MNKHCFPVVCIIFPTKIELRRGGNFLGYVLFNEEGEPGLELYANNGIVTLTMVDLEIIQESVNQFLEMKK